MAKNRNKGLTPRSLSGLYHPEAVEHILNTQKERGPLTHKDAEVLDQEWAASRLAEFSKGHRGTTDYLAHIMSQAPNNAATSGADTRRARKEVSNNPSADLKVTENVEWDEGAPTARGREVLGSI